MQSYANLKTRISSLVQDSGGAIFVTTTDGEMELAVKDCLREFSRYVPHIVKVTYQVESRTGTATSTSALHLIDATNAEFLSTDVNKVVYNSTDKTWAVITAYNSTSDVTISKDIFIADENFEIYNKGCSNAKQINIGDVTDYLWVDRLEYPINTMRAIDSIEGDILEIGLDFTPNDTADTDADKDVYVYFNKRHKVSQLTTLTGATTASYVAGDTSMALGTLQTTGTIEEGQEFTIAYRKEIYTVTAAATIATSAATISFYPGLEAPVASTTVVTFKQSTLTPLLEPIFCQYVAGSLAKSKASQPIQSTVNAIAVLTTASTAIGNMSARITQSIADIVSGRTQTDKGVVLITANAALAIAKLDAEVAQALADLDTGRALVNLINKGGVGVPTDYVNYASGDLRNARGYLEEGIGYMRQAQADEGLSGTYGALSARELSNASQYLNQAVGYLRQISGNLSVASGWRHYYDWGRVTMEEAIRELQSEANPRKALSYSRTEV